MALIVCRAEATLASPFVMSLGENTWPWVKKKKTFENENGGFLHFNDFQEGFLGGLFDPQSLTCGDQAATSTTKALQTTQMTGCFKPSSTIQQLERPQHSKVLRLQTPKYLLPKRTATLLVLGSEPYPFKKLPCIRLVRRTSLRFLPFP